MTRARVRPPDPQRRRIAGVATIAGAVASLLGATGLLGGCAGGAATGARTGAGGDANPASGAAGDARRTAFAPAAPAPALPAGPLTRIAFGSCADEEAPQPIWDAVLAYRPELYVFAGDNVYGDYTDGRQVPLARTLEALRGSYEKASRVPGMVAVRAQVPHLAVWDDHDYGRNDAGADFPYKADAKSLFLEFWQVPADDPRRRHDGVYDAVTIGPPGRRVQLILLDTRWFRSPLRRIVPRPRGEGPYEPDDDPAKTMLGDAQWRWLAERLREPAELRLLVSSIQVVAEAHRWERWGNLPRELDRLRRVVADSGAGGLVLLSGDRHIGAIYRASDGWPYPVTELTSSGINRFYADNREPGPNRLGEVYGAPNFGTIDVDWATGTVRLALRGLDGTIARETRVALTDLRARR